MTTNTGGRIKLLYVVGAVALVLVAATAMAMGGKLANVGPWAKGSGGHGMGAMNHSADNMTCDGQAQHDSPRHSSRGNRTHEGNMSCGGNWTHG